MRSSAIFAPNVLDLPRTLDLGDRDPCFLLSFFRRRIVGRLGSTEPIGSKRCRDLWAPLLVLGVNPPQLVRQAARTLHAISVKAHPVIHLLVNALCPWDLWFTYRLPQIQGHVAAHLPTWLDRLAEVEAASAHATFAAPHPSYRWPDPLTPDPQRNGSQARIVATGLAHPLIPERQRVSNDLAIETLGTVVLVTGSNMSGKSTFLRTLGINLCLAQAGAPVCAGLFEWGWFRLATCIRVDDSLEAGLSFFYKSQRDKL